MDIRDGQYFIDCLQRWEKDHRAYCPLQQEAAGYLGWRHSSKVQQCLWR